MKNYFHFTLGPVQSFVAQARRTRDFWAGSFLLSWLSSIAMLSVEKQGGRILFPTPDEHFKNALLKKGRVKPKQGNVPNRFMAEISEKEKFDPENITQSVQGAWKALSELIWEKDLKKITSLSIQTRVIWDRQIGNFWNIEWVLVDDKFQTDVLDRLKHWRTYLPPDEPGIKCMMMDGWQELSGAPSPIGQEGRAFWDKLRKSGTSGMDSDLREGEMLCAMGFIKRRFARYFDEFCYQLPGNNADTGKIYGWQLSPGVLSVDFLAAAHWLAELIQRADQSHQLREDFSRFHNNAYTLTNEYGEWGSNVSCVKAAIKKSEHLKEHKWEALNGEVFFASILENGKLWEPKREEAASLAKELTKLRNRAELPEPTPFYAILLMDGDELGIHMSDTQNHSTITERLAEFTKKVDCIVSKHSGFLVYAGGDDALALLPLEDALPCALALRHHYQICFQDLAINTSLSGAIEYAHIHTPLGKVLADAHDLLDNLVKEGCGRDAIGCRVWRPGGMTLEWAMPWKLAIGGGQIQIQTLAEKFARETEKDANFSNKFFYRVRERFALLNGVKNPDENDVKMLTDLLATDYQRSRTSSPHINAKDKSQQSDETKQIETLITQCQPRLRNKETPPSQWEPLTVNTDGALLVRFLAKEGLYHDDN